MEKKERKVGYKDRNYFYKPIRTEILSCSLVSETDVDKLRNAIDSSLLELPHFAVRPVIKDGEFFYEANDSEVLIVKDDERCFFMGSDETNGYLFYFRYSEKSFSIVVYHGLADFTGIMQFIQNVLYHYSRECGFQLPDIRIKESDSDELDRFDPYLKYADRKAEGWSYKSNQKPFMLPIDSTADKADGYRYYELRLKLDDFLGLTKRWETSFMPAIVSLISGVIEKEYEVKDEIITAYTTVNLRNIMDSLNQTNFSETIALPMDSGLRKLEPKEKGKAIRKMLDEQRAPENLRYLMAELLRGVDKIEGHEVQREVSKAVLPIPTYLFTYPGRIEIPDGYEKVITGYDIDSVADLSKTPNAVAISCKTTGNVMQLSLLCPQNIDSLVKRIIDEFDALGVELFDKRSCMKKGDSFDINKIKDCDAKK